MFKILIIDDEPTIRRGLVNVINWKQYQCEVCGEARDGVEGIELIKECKPDIIFADINMPEINGLEMIKEGKKIVPHCKFIILSGYREFTYMQEALKVGAFDYLLKPSNIEDICEVVKRAVMELKYQRDTELEIQKLRKCFNESIPILKEKLLYDIMYNINLNHEEIEESFKLYNVNIDTFIMAIIDVENNSNKREPYQRQLYQFGIVNTFTEMLSDKYDIEKIVLNNSQIAFIISGQPKMIDEDIICKKIENVKQVIESCFDFTVSIALSSIGHGYADISTKLNECKKAFQYRFYMGESSIILQSDINEFCKFQDTSWLDDIKKNLCEAVKVGNITDVGNYIKEIKSNIKKLNLKPEDIKTLYCNLAYEINIVIILTENEEGYGNSVPNQHLYNSYKQIDEANGIDELNTVLEETAMSAVSKINRYNRCSITQALHEAAAYIEENYYKQLTLNELADSMYVSTFYLSRMFKKELGKSFTEYLNEVRIKNAKRLLKDMGAKTYEVAQEVGIQDAQYFSKLFKKHVNMTPTEYRDKIMKELIQGE